MKKVLFDTCILIRLMNEAEDLHPAILKCFEYCLEKKDADNDFGCVHCRIFGSSRRDADYAANKSPAIHASNGNYRGQTYNAAR